MFITGSFTRIAVATAIAGKANSAGIRRVNINTANIAKTSNIAIPSIR
jgi:hypothetical protein